MYEFHDEAWADVSPEAMEMIKKMLCVNRQKRWTAQQLLSHPWFDHVPGVKPVEIRRKDSLFSRTSFVRLPVAINLIFANRQTGESTPGSGCSRSKYEEQRITTTTTTTTTTPAPSPTPPPPTPVIGVTVPTLSITQRRNSFASSRAGSARSKGSYSQLNSQRSETGGGEVDGVRSVNILRRGSAGAEGMGEGEVVPVMYKSLSEWQLAYDALLLSSKRVNLR